MKTQRRHYLTLINNSRCNESLETLKAQSGVKCYQGGDGNIELLECQTPDMVCGKSFPVADTGEEEVEKFCYPRSEEYTVGCSEKEEDGELFTQCFCECSG